MFFNNLILICYKKITLIKTIRMLESNKLNRKYDLLKLKYESEKKLIDYWKNKMNF